MTDLSMSGLRQAIIALHRSKDAAYGPAWKRRGEQISVLANIARKVDRLEWAMTGAPATADESFLDTCIDLYVYCVKYETFLADLDDQVVAHLWRNVLTPPFSNGVRAFEWIVEREAFEAPSKPGSVADAVAATVSTFADVERSFADCAAALPPLERWAKAHELRTKGLDLVLVAATTHPELAQLFIDQQQGGSDAG
jgi:hypothetical protein